MGPRAKSIEMTAEAKAKQQDQNLNALAVAFLVAALVGGFALLPRVFRSREYALVGQEAPAFELPAVLNAVDGRPQLTLASLRGKAVVLDFWATWCGPCRAEAPILDRLSQRYRDRGLVVVGVNTNEEQGFAEAYAQKVGLTYPIVYDTRSSAASAYGVSSFPTLVVVNREGKVSAVRIGATDDAELDRLVRQVL